MPYTEYRSLFFFLSFFFITFFRQEGGNYWKRKGKGKLTEFGWDVTSSLRTVLSRVALRVGSSHFSDGHFYWSWKENSFFIFIIFAASFWRWYLLLKGWVRQSRKRSWRNWNELNVKWTDSDTKKNYEKISLRSKRLQFAFC